VVTPTLPGRHSATLAELQACRERQHRSTDRWFPLHPAIARLIWHAFGTDHPAVLGGRDVGYRNIVAELCTPDLLQPSRAQPAPPAVLEHSGGRSSCLLRLLAR
jgi:hypothetical protein